MMIPTRNYFRALLVGLTMCLGLTTCIFIAQTAMAQTVSGDITGTVTDSSKAAIANASVAATNEATGLSFTAVTNGVGEYRFVNLPPGSYTIAVTAPGFAKSVVKGFAVELNKTATANMTLKITATETTVEVSAEAGVALDTTTAQVQTTFATVALTELPDATNNVLNLS